MDKPYSLYTITALSIFFYLLTYFLYKLKIITRVTHRKIWNVILLVCFAITGISGIIMTIIVNYKLQIPFIEELNFYHVDFAILMTITGIIHFIWHFTYFVKIAEKFRKIFSGREKSGTHIQNINLYSDQSISYKTIDKWLLIPVLLLGFTAITTQVILLREFLSVFYGNELVIGIILANWMLFTGIGAYLGRSSGKLVHSAKFIVYSQALLGTLPLLTAFLLDALRNVIFPIGSMVGVMQVFYTSAVLLLPFCLLSGFLFTFYCRYFSEKYNTNFISKIYSIEAAGSITGGIILNFILIYFLQTFQMLTLLLFINLTAAVIFAFRNIAGKHRYAILILSLVLLFFPVYFNLDTVSRTLLFVNQEILAYKDTPYGKLVITGRGEQLNFYNNNNLLFYTNNVIANEEAVHYAMIQHPSPKKVLLISGGISGIIDEIRKYNIEKIDYVELDPWIIKLGKTFSNSIDNPVTRVINMDPRLCVKRTKKKYDIVLINVPEPSTAQANRFYTAEFFSELKNILSLKAVIQTSVMSTENYMGEEAKKVNSSIFNTLKTVFRNVLLVPGEKNFFIASDNELSINITAKIEEKQIENTYVNQYYIDDALLAQRSAYITSSLDLSEPCNTDFMPIAYFSQINYWLSHFKFNYWLIAGILVIFALVFLFRLNPVALGIFTGGFTASSIEMILLLSFQIIYGYVYQMLGIIITVFMAGLVLGASFRNKITERNPQIYLLLQYLLGIYCILLPVIILNMNNAAPFFVNIVFILLALLVAMLTGMEFSLASVLQKKNIALVAGKLYAVDLAGSAIGILLITVYLIPLIGITYCCILAGVLDIYSGTVWMVKKVRE